MRELAMPAVRFARRGAAEQPDRCASVVKRELGAVAARAESDIGAVCEAQCTVGGDFLGERPATAIDAVGIFNRSINALCDRLEVVHEHVIPTSCGVRQVNPGQLPHCPRCQGLRRSRVTACSIGIV